MVFAGEALKLTQDPAWPWSLPTLGPLALGAVALVLIGLTVWTYVGVPGTGVRRLLVVIGLRLAALLCAVLMLLRPSLAFREELHLPSTLLIALDGSESMTIQDQSDSQSRWDYQRRVLHEAEPLLQKLRDEQNVNVVLYRFAEDVGAFDAQGKADGKRTDFGQMLHSLFERHGHDRNLRGLLVFSDGADNGMRYPALSEAARFRSLPCPVSTFGLGLPTTADEQRDIAFAERPGAPAIIAEPSPVGVKGKLTVKGILDAPGFENATVTLRLLLDGKEVATGQEILRKTRSNEVKLVTDAPEKPGEIRVTLKVDPLPGEVSVANNEISTYCTVTKEGISVLFVDKPRFPEPQLICDALSVDPRIRLYMAWRRTDEPALDQVDLFQFSKRHYDVIILGDVSARRLAAGNPQALAEIHDLVRNKGTGLLMMGGYDSFGNSDWNNTKIADLLPVELDVRGQYEGPVKIEPTKEGVAHYIRLTDKDADNGPLWAKLPELDGMTRLGTPKLGAVVLANRAGTREPVLVGEEYGKGRTLAFAGDTTWRWERLGQPGSEEGVVAHAHFWRQLVLWLAHQDKVEGNAYVLPDERRLPAGSKLGFKVGLRGKGGQPLDDAQFEVTAVGPEKAEIPVPTARDQGTNRGIFWKTDTPGEYRLTVKAWPKGADRATTPAEKAEARFYVYQSDTEMARRAADHEFLTKLANAGGGKFHRADELSTFLRELAKVPQTQAKPKTQLWPDWRRNTLSGFLVGFFLLFVALLCLEWFLRRYWGMV